MPVNTAAGTNVYLGTTAESGVSDTYTLIGEVINIGEFGRKYNVVKHNPLSSRGTKKFKGSYDDGSLQIQLGRDTSDAGQIAARAATDIDLDYNIKIEANDAVLPTVLTGVSMSAATPGVVTKTAHGLPVNTAVKYTAGAGTLPTGIVDGTTYYVKTVPTADTFTVSATAGGTAIATTGSPAGTYTVTTVPSKSYFLMKAQVMSYTANFGSVDDIVKATMDVEIQSGTITEYPRSI